jgi:hypothetical protein
LKRERDEMDGIREGHIYMPRTDNTTSLISRTQKLTEWCSGNALDLYSGDALFGTCTKVFMAFLSFSRQISSLYLYQAMTAVSFPILSNHHSSVILPFDYPCPEN